MEDTRKHIAVLGCGWFGLPLAKELVNDGYVVNGSTTSEEKVPLLKECGIEPHLFTLSDTEELVSPSFFDSDILFITIPPNLKRGEGQAYPGKIETICNAAAKGSVKQLVLISSTGVYSNCNGEVNEHDRPEPVAENGLMLLEAEEIVMHNQPFTSTIVRFGGLFGPNREPGRFLKGRKTIPNGLAPVNMIHLVDCVGICKAIIQKNAFGRVYNACAPRHPTRKEFYSKATRELGLEEPEFIEECLDWKMVNSVHVPTYLNYEFKNLL